jgi:hypothetical protein
MPVERRLVGHRHEGARDQAGGDEGAFSGSGRLLLLTSSTAELLLAEVSETPSSFHVIDQFRFACWSGRIEACTAMTGPSMGGSPERP